MTPLRQPLLRLLAINLAGGVVAALLMVGGLVSLNPVGLRDLILGDHSPATTLGVLLFGFVITFGSAAMGSAIMMLGRSDGRGGRARPAAAQAVVRKERGEIRTGPRSHFAALDADNVD